AASPDREIPSRNGSTMRRFSCVLAFGLALLGACPDGFAADSKKSESYLGEARKSLDKNDVKTALIQLKNAVQADPDNAVARFELGRLQLRLGDYLSAEKELLAARDRNHPEAEVAIPLAETYLRQQKYDLLLREIPEGTRPDAIEAEVRLNRGLAQIY